MELISSRQKSKSYPVRFINLGMPIYEKNGGWIYQGMNCVGLVRGSFAVVVAAVCFVIGGTGSGATPTPEVVPPASGSGTAASVYVPWKQITIIVDGRNPEGDKFTYDYGPGVVVLDPSGKSMEITKITGLEVTFTAVPNKHRVNMLSKPMEITKITVKSLTRKFLHGNTTPEQPSEPNLVTVSGNGTIDEVSLHDSDGNIALIEIGADPPRKNFSFDRNLVLTDADGKNVDISVAKHDMKVSYTAILDKEKRWEVGKLTKLVLTEFRALATSSETSAPESAAKVEGAPSPSASTPKKETSDSPPGGKLSQEQPATEGIVAPQSGGSSNEKGVQMEDLGPVPKQILDSLCISEDWLHIAAVMPSGSRQVVLLRWKGGAGVR